MPPCLVSAIFFAFKRFTNPLESVWYTRERIGGWTLLGGRGLAILPSQNHGCSHAAYIVFESPRDITLDFVYIYIYVCVCVRVCVCIYSCHGRCRAPGCFVVFLVFFAFFCFCLMMGWGGWGGMLTLMFMLR